MLILFLVELMAFLATSTFSLVGDAAVLRAIVEFWGSLIPAASS